MTVHVVASTPTTVRSGYLDPQAAPVAIVRSGDIVRYPATWTHWGNEAVFGMSFAEREPLRHRYPEGPYSMVGPVEVASSEPGDTVECSLVALRTIDWGWNSFPLGVGALPADFADPYVHYFRFDDSRTRTVYVHGIELPLAPFAGVLAVEPETDQHTSAILAGAWGGNLVLRDFVAGTSMFLPVSKAGARIWLGDIHALQGDGVVDQTAIETAAADLRMRYTLHRRVALRAPLLDSGTAWTLIGFGATLDDALVSCLREVIHWLSTAGGLSAAEAYAFASMAVSFRVTQYSHQTGSAYSATPPKAVHAVIPKDRFPADIVMQVTRWLRPPS